MGEVSVDYFLASYGAAYLLELIRLFRRSSTVRAAMQLFSVIGLAMHTVYLLARSRETDLPPLLSSSHDWMLVLAWLVILLLLFLSLMDRNLAIGLFLLPLVLILVGSTFFVSIQPAAAVGDDPSMMERVTRSWAMLHASLLVFGAVGVMGGFVLSLMYVVQHRRLKHKQASQPGLTLPNLEKLARWNRWSVILSVPLLTLGMVIGVGLALLPEQSPNAKALFTDPIIIGYGVVWLCMVVFFMKLVTPHRPAPKQVAWLTIWAFGFLMVTLIGLEFVGGGEMFSLKSLH